MNTKKFNTSIGLFALVLASGEVRGESAADIGILPSQKVPAPVHESDRNPFGTRIAPSENQFGNFDSESEESRIRQIFSGLVVSGRVVGSNGRPRVLLGDLILAEGEEVPQVIENQTDVLRVTRIGDKEIELTWVDEQVVDQPRKLPIKINLEPSVSFILPGRNIQQSGGRLVTMDNPAKEKAGTAAAEASGSRDPLVSAEDENAGDDTQEEKPQPEKSKRVSPFGLFRK